MNKYKIKLMRLNQRRQKHHPFLTILQKNKRPQKKSIDAKNGLETFNNNMEQDENTLGKYRGKSFKQRKSQSINRNIAVNHSFVNLGKQTKTKRTLLEENNELKKKIEHLSVSKNFKKDPISKKIECQFDKELYWSGSQTYMISGIKLQYQKMKENFQRKSEQYQLLLKSIDVCHNMELMTYIEALQVENNILACGAQNMTRKDTESLADQSSLSMILWLKERLEFSESKIDKFKQKNRIIKQQIKQMNNKLAFLEKLLIQKDNNEHSAHRNIKKCEKQKDQLRQKVLALETSIKSIKLTQQKQIIDLKRKQAQEMMFEREKLSETHKQLHDHVVRLQKENTYLHNLVASWKQQKLNNPKKDKGKDTSKSKVQKTHSMPMDGDITAHHLQRLKIQQMMPKIKYREQQQITPRQQKRTSPYSAQNKNSQNAIKNRRVQLYQLEDIIDYGRYILIAKDYDLQWLVSQFDYEGEDQWKKQYINLKETRIIFQEHMNLSEQNSLMLARYIIENADTQHVYTDDINEHVRIVVKSIIRHLFGQYSIYKDKREQFENILEQSRAKLEFTLQNTTKGGVIPKDRFRDLMDSVQLGKPDLIIYCLSKMSMNSTSLDSLKYDCLINKKRKQE